MSYSVGIKLWFAAQRTTERKISWVIKSDQCCNTVGQIKTSETILKTQQFSIPYIRFQVSWVEARRVFVVFKNGDVGPFFEIIRLSRRINQKD